MLSSSLSVNGEEVTRSKINTSITIPNVGWVVNTGDYSFKLDLVITGVLSTDYIIVDILPDYQDIAASAGISNYCLEYDGGITLYANQIPSDSINARYTKIRG